MDINTRVLSEVAYQLEKGNPWWGMALCNRYLAATSPLRRAIALRFAQKIGRHQADTSTAQALIGGLDTGALLREPQLLGPRAIRPRRSIPTPGTKRSQSLRLATRTRAPHSPRYALHLEATRGNPITHSNARTSYLSAVRSR